MQGITRGGLPNPYGSSKLISPITWGEFYQTIPKNLFAALLGTVFIFTIVILGDKKPTKEEDASKNEIKGTNIQ